MRRPFPLAASLFAFAAGAAHAADPPPRRQAATVAYFSGLQEASAFTPDEMAQRAAGAGLDPEAQAADVALNGWKLCVLEAVERWGELHPGPGTLVDGAFGRCFDGERRYRDALLALKQDGRQTVDLQLAKALARALEESWRPRLVAAVLDRELAAHHPAPALEGPEVRAAGSARP